MEMFLEAGKIINTHGVRGDVKLEHWCDSAAVLAELGTLYFKKGGSFEPRAVTSASVYKNFVLVKFEGIDTFEDAIKFKNTYTSPKDILLPDESILSPEFNFLI